MPASSFTDLDLDAWPRAGLYRIFRGYQHPHFTITTRLDVSALAREHVPQGVSLYRASAYAIAHAANAVEAFRLRLVGDGVRRYERVDVSSTVAGEQALLFGYTDFDPRWPVFDRALAASDEAARAGRLDPSTQGRHDLLYLSCLPWIDVHAMTHAYAGPDDDIPRISWGRVVTEGERSSMGICVQVHHALVDGADVAAFIQHTQQRLDDTAFSNHE